MKKAESIKKARNLYLNKTGLPFTSGMSNKVMIKYVSDYIKNNTFKNLVVDLSVYRQILRLFTGSGLIDNE